MACARSWTASTWSPRERGWTLGAQLAEEGLSVVPARAGVDRGTCGSDSRLRSGPRASGGGPVVDYGFIREEMWSPRERGWTRSIRFGSTG